MNDKRRRFTKNQRAILFLASNGRSEISGDALKANWHADHITPWSKGGRTDIANAQALNADENLRKGNRQ